MIGMEIRCYEYKFRSKLCFRLCVQLRAQGLTNVWIACSVGHSSKDALILLHAFFVTFMLVLSYKMRFLKSALEPSTQSQVKVSFSKHPEKMSRPCKIIFFLSFFLSCLLFLAVFSPGIWGFQILRNLERSRMITNEKNN